LTKILIIALRYGQYLARFQAIPCANASNKVAQAWEQGCQITPSPPRTLDGRVI